MSELKRTQLYDAHVQAGATMVDFGGWEMPVQYPTGVVAEHLYTRRSCGLFDVSHMGRIIVEGPQRLEFLQYVLTSNAAALEMNKAQYCILSDEDGCAIDDAYLYKYEEDKFFLVVNAGNVDKDWAHLSEQIKRFDARMTNISKEWGAIAVQGPKSEEILNSMADQPMPGPKRNACASLKLEGRDVRVARTGYTAEANGFEVYVKTEDTVWLWNRLIELGAMPAGLGARDTLRMEGCLPLYGHEMGADPDGKKMPVYAVPLSRFAVKFADEKGDFIGKAALEKQNQAHKEFKEGNFALMADVLPRRIFPIALTGRGVMRAEMPVCKGEKQIGWVTSGTMIPYYLSEAEGEESAKRAIGMCYIDSDSKAGDEVEVEVRGKRVSAVITTKHIENTEGSPYVHPVVAGK